VHSSGLLSSRVLYGRAYDRQIPLGLEIGALQTLAMIALVWGGEGALYALRERQRPWNSIPSRWVIVALIGDVLFIPTLAICGLAMKSLSIAVVISVLAAAVLFTFLRDLVKVPVFRRLQIA
jgi:H+-transporting ATPase